MNFDRNYMKIHDMWKDLGWRIMTEFETPENPNELVWYACHMDGETLQKVLIHGMKIKNENVNNTISKTNDTEVEKVDAEIVNGTPVETNVPLENIEVDVGDNDANNADDGLSMEVSHEEEPKSEFELKVSTGVFIGSKIEEAFEATGVSFIDYHYLYLIGDTAREMERQLDKIEYVEAPDLPDDSIASDTSETNDSDKSDKTVIDGIEVSKKEEQSLLEGDF